jgi:hypothetical protein
MRSSLVDAPSLVAVFCSNSVDCSTVPQWELLSTAACSPGPLSSSRLQSGAHSDAYAAMAGSKKNRQKQVATTKRQQAGKPRTSLHSRVQECLARVRAAGNKALAETTGSWCLLLPACAVQQQQAAVGDPQRRLATTRAADRSRQENDAGRL